VDAASLELNLNRASRPVCRRSAAGGEQFHGRNRYRGKTKARR
jgi:hypothetical protein